MLVIASKPDENTVCVHLVLGPETDVNFAVGGMQKIDISDFLKNSEGCRVFIALTRSHLTESVLEGVLRGQMKQAQPSDFPLSVGNPTGKSKKEVTPEGNLCYCCHSKDVVPNSYPPVCSSCIALNSGLAASRRNQKKDSGSAS